MTLASVEEGAAALRAQLGLGAEVACAPQLLAAGPGRQVVDYRFESAAAPRLIGKFYPDEQGRVAYGAMATLRSALDARPAALLAIPAPLSYNPAHRLLVMGAVEGEPLSDLARSARAEEALRLVGLALAELHQLPAAGLPARTLRDHMEDLVRPHPAALGARALALWGKLLAAERPHPSAVVHRDLHLRQLFLCGGQVWLIDWDLVAAGDPALDVGNFCAYLHTHLGAEAPAGVGAFLRGYIDGGGGAAAARAPLFAAFTYLRLACKATRLGRPDAAEGLIVRGLRALESEDTGG